MRVGRKHDPTAHNSINRVVAPEEVDSSLADEMAATVKAALKNQNGMWFGWSGKMTDQPASEPRTHQVNKVTYAQIDLSKSDIQEYCDGLANSVLWPILHCRVDLQQYSRARIALARPSQPDWLFSAHALCAARRSTDSATPQGDPWGAHLLRPRRIPDQERSRQF